MVGGRGETDTQAETHLAIQACVVSGCYETLASSMAGVFPTSGLVQPGQEWK